MTLTDMPSVPRALCSCYDDEDACECSDTERFLRSGMKMSSEQRDWCLREIEQVEGHNRKDYADLSDKDLGRATISAWIDYCRDKGLM